MGSTRLPGKALLPLGDQPIVYRVVERLRHVEALADVVVATGDLPENDPIRAFCASESISCFSGSDDDVLDRYYQAAVKFGADPVLRVSSDCPLVDPLIVTRALDMFVTHRDDIVYLGFDKSFPEGLDVEVIAFEALAKAWRESHLKSDREHVTPYIWRQPDLFPQDVIRNGTAVSPEHWSVDREQDYEFVGAIHRALYRPGATFHMADVLALLNEHPELRLVNSGAVRQEGYLKSLREDHLTETATKGPDA
jgi:spore coat polysaccharide biosynthesis protein SpsF